MEALMGIDVLMEGISGKLPTVVSIALSVLSLFLAFTLNRRKVDIEEKTSISSATARQVDSLMTQIVLLSNELERTREQLTALHEQNIELMVELRAANRRIGELEQLIGINHSSRNANQ